jgi:hypothetical protein
MKMLLEEHVAYKGNLRNKEVRKLEGTELFQSPRGRLKNNVKIYIKWS